MSDEPVHFQLSEVVRWLRAHDKRNLCFGGWPDDILEIYLRWHHANGSLFMVEDRGSLTHWVSGHKWMKLTLIDTGSRDDPRGTLFTSRTLWRRKRRGGSMRGRNARALSAMAGT